MWKGKRPDSTLFVVCCTGGSGGASHRRKSAATMSALPYVSFAANRWPAALAAAAIPATCIALPDDFVAYLNSDGLLLPRPAPGVRVKSCDPRHGDEFEVRVLALLQIGWLTRGV